MYGLVSVVLVTVMIETGSFPLSLAVALGTGVLFGLVNGVLVQTVRIPAFITTLGGFYIAYAIAQMISAGSMLSMPADDLFIGLQTGSSSSASPTSWSWRRWWPLSPGSCSTTRPSAARSWPSATTA